MEPTKGQPVSAAYAHESWALRLADAWGHHSPELLSASVVAAIVVGLRPPPGAFALTVPLALLLFVLGSWLMMRRHDRRLCEHCAAAIPLNAAEQAARSHRRFWMAHTGSERRFLIPYLAVLLGSNFGLAATGTPGKIAWALIQASMVYLIMSHATHRRLQPWCPWCSDGGGGSKRDEVAPPPVLPDRQLV